MSNVSTGKKTLTREEVERLCAKRLAQLPVDKYPVVAWGIRGADLDMGKPGVNDRGVWDDRNGWLDRRPGGGFYCFEANCDPTAQYREGLGSVAAGQILYFKIGKHKGRDAYRQASTFLVHRDGVGLVKATKDRAFNWHDSIAKSGGTSSEGCQTNPLKVFRQGVKKVGDPLIKAVYANDETFPFILEDMVEEFAVQPVPVVLKNPKSLARGMRGDGVKVLQRALGLTADGIFGSDTEKAVVAFQKAKKLDADGIAGPKTLAALEVKKEVAEKVPVTGKQTVNAAGIKLIKDFESCRLKAYLDTGKVPTIGWGTTRYPNGKAVKMGDVCTRAEADAWFAHDIQTFSAGVTKRVKVPVTPNQFSALVSFAYNVGEAAFGSSTLLKLLNKTDYAGASAQLPRWNKDNGKTLAGLTRRRLAEQKLFNA